MTLPVTPLVAVDIIIEIQDYYPIQLGITSLYGTPVPPQRKPGIVLIERKNPPYGYALPGGMVDVGETTRQAAIREAQEETGLKITQLELLDVYDDPKRDPRSHTISIVYVAKAIGWPVAADDAKTATVVDPLQMGQYIDKLCCDHREIITDYIVRYYNV